MKIEREPTFKRNYKALKKKHYDMNELEKVITLLVNQDTQALKKYRDHALIGNLQGLRELHIKNDWLLIYAIDDDKLTLFLLATGKHDDVF